MRTKSILAEIAKCDNPDKLAEISRQVDLVLAEMVDAQSNLKMILDNLSRLHLALTNRVLRFAEAKLESRGYGPTPLPYCWINMGSAARKEQTLRTDQDNGLIYADADSEQQRCRAAEYFELLAREAVTGLARCGFALCPGKVMATSRKWRGPLELWQDRVSRWMNSTAPSDTRNLTIMLDFFPVRGDFRLAQAVRTKVFNTFAESMAARHMLSWDDHNSCLPLGFFGNIQTAGKGPHKGQLNLKNSALIHLVNGIRLLAIQYRIKVSATLERIERLNAGRHITDAEKEQLEESFETLMLLKIRVNLTKIRQGANPDNFLNPATLEPYQLGRLKKALAVVMQLQKSIERQFRVPWMSFFGT